MVIMRVRAEGYAKERADVENLEQQLKDMKYRVRPTTVKISTKDPKYKYHFDLEVEIIPETLAAAKIAADKK